jgi:hypothetical protein
MNDIDRELREALRRKQPSAGFASRVAERVEQSRGPRPHRWRWIPASIAACLAVFAGDVYWERYRQPERAKEQLMLALQITGQKLNLVEGMAVERMAAKNLEKQEQPK